MVCFRDQIQVSTNLSPAKSPVAYVHPSKYVDYKLNPDLQTAERCINLLTKAGYNVSSNNTFDWIHDVFLILIRMFPKACPPTMIISINARYDPHYHMKVGSTLRQFRKENYLLIGTGVRCITSIGIAGAPCFDAAIASRRFSRRIQYFLFL